MKKVADFFNKLFGALMPGVDWKNIPVSTYVRYFLTLVATVNSMLMAFGLTPINVEEDTVTFVMTLIFNAIILIVNTYKDNPTSKEGVFAALLRGNLKHMKAEDATRLMNNITAILMDPDVEVIKKPSTEEAPVEESSPGDNSESPVIDGVIHKLEEKMSTAHPNTKDINLDTMDHQEVPPEPNESPSETETAEDEDVVEKPSTDS